MNLEDLIASSPALSADIEKSLRLQDNRSAHWSNKDIKYFVNYFREWLVYNPPPWAGPKYIEPFDELANSDAGDVLFNNKVFSSWFISFVNARGQYLATPQSLEGGTLANWQSFPAVRLDSFKPPYGKAKYDSFIDIFLRVPKEPFRMDGKDNSGVTVSPANGKIHQIYSENIDSHFR